MFRKIHFQRFHVVFAALIVLTIAVTANSQGTAFSYQGKLTDGGNPANGSYDLQFVLFDSLSGGAQIGATLTRSAVAVGNGIFRVQLDYGAGAFSGSERFLEISVRPADVGNYITLSPRQQISSTPYAVRSLNAGTADGLSVACINCVTSSQIQNVQGSQISGAIPVASVPTGSTNYIQNTTTQQAGSNFNVSGNGVVGGSLGIGTTAPTARLTVVGGGFTKNLFVTDNNTTATSFDLGNTSTGGRTWRMQSVGGGVFGRVGNFEVWEAGNSVNGLTIQPNGTVLMGSNLKAGGILVADDYGYDNPGKNDLIVKGNVGIGVTNPSSKLVVFGSTDPLVTSDVVDAFGFNNNVGIHGRTGTAFGILGSVSDSGYAGYFMGRVNVTGTLSKGAGSFKIDHPLDPANKYLYHSFVESPDMMNIYNGNITTDENGDATIRLPDYFEALNQDFSYQLTAIGQFAQAIVASEIKDNQFSIKTDKPRVKVSWQVTGIRHDAFANANRIQVEEVKPAKERGFYLHPELFGQPEEKSVEWALTPETMRRIKEQRAQVTSSNSAP